MIYISAIIYGLIQGLCEFLPVSSSGHLVLAHRLMPLPFSNDLAFDVMLHLGTLAALLVFFYKDSIHLIKLFFLSFKAFPQSLLTTPCIIIFSSIPAVIAGVLLNDVVENKFGDPVYVAIALIILALVFIWVEKHPERFIHKEVGLKQGLLIGLAQAIAIIPGVSRSGITIIAGLSQGIKREVAVRFSFLLSMTIVAGAGLKKTPELFSASMDSTQLIVISIAFLSAFLSGLWAIGFMLNWVKGSTLKPFAYYRIILAIIILLLLV